MRVLVSCEFSGIVRDAFASRGHDAWSCDLLPCERGGNHYEGDALDLLGDGWDLIISHPPCQYLCNSGVRWLYTSKYEDDFTKDGARWARMRSAARFFKAMLDAPATRVAVENPIMHRYAKEAGDIPKATQIIHPWQFWAGEPGRGEVKATCLWLKGLTKLNPTTPGELGRVARVHHEPPSPDRWKNRSRTHQGIADAMADAWK